MFPYKTFTTKDTSKLDNLKKERKHKHKEVKPLPKLTEKHRGEKNMNIYFEDKEKLLVDENNELRNRLDAYEAMLAIMIQKLDNEVFINDTEIYQIANSKTKVVQISGFNTDEMVLTTRAGTRNYWMPILKEKNDMSKNYLWKFYWDCGRMGNVEGLFVATQKEINELIGEKVNFDEILGKHSEVFGIVEEDEIVKIDIDSDIVDKISENLGKTWSGYNPLEYIEN